MWRRAALLTLPPPQLAAGRSVSPASHQCESSGCTTPLLVLSCLAFRALRPHLFHCACSASSSLGVLFFIEPPALCRHANRGAVWRQW